MGYNVPKQHWVNETCLSAGLRTNFDSLGFLTRHLNLNMSEFFFFFFSFQAQNAIATEPLLQVRKFFKRILSPFYNLDTSRYTSLCGVPHPYTHARCQMSAGRKLHSPNLLRCMKSQLARKTGNYLYLSLLEKTRILIVTISTFCIQSPLRRIRR